MIKDHEIKDAMDILSQISGDEEIVRLAEMREKAILDENTRINSARKEGIKAGIQKGRIQERIDVAIKLLDVLDDEIISEKTGLDIEEIKKLRSKK